MMRIRVLAALGLLAAAPPAAAYDISDMIRRACGNDVRRLCPAEFAALERGAPDHAAIRRCMYANRAFVGGRCGAAWMREHAHDHRVGE
jgi:hypothetical protein